MSIAELGALGEFLASIAVFVTLVILIFQFRSARKDLSLQTTREIRRHNNDAFYQLTQDPTLMDAHIRGQLDIESLTEQEKVTWTLWVFTWITQTEEGYIARRNGIPDMAWVERYMLGVATVLRSNGGSIIWPKLKLWFDEEFTVDLESKIAEGEETWLEVILD